MIGKPSNADGTWRRNTFTADDLVAWRIYYTHGREASSATSTWALAPSSAVAGVIYYHRGGGRTVSVGYDIYELPGEDGEKYGEMMSEAGWALMQARIESDLRPAP